MATVYLAEDMKHHRNVAVKVLRSDIAATLGADRFLREIEVAAQLQHPHILPLHDSGEADGFLYYVMPYVEGQSLRDKLAHESELPIADAVRILRDVVDALTEAHAKGVVHRDVKPENILLRGRHALVTDFGVAKAVSEATGRATLTTAGVALGTPSYMAPEQAVADPHLDHRVDIYAVGAVAYELLTGRPPFTGSNAQAVLSAHVTEAAVPVTKHRETVPAQLESLVMRCLEKKPADRWQSAEQLLPELEALVTPSGGITPTDTRPVSAVAGAKSPWLKAGVGAAALAAIGVLAVALAGRGGSDTPIDPELIAVFPFSVTGGDDVQYLGEGMVNLFESNLATGEGLRAVAAQRSIAAWRGAGGSEASAERALAAARSVGAGLALQGNLVQSGRDLVINASLAETSRGEERRATASGPVDSVASLVGRLTAELLVLHAGERADRAPMLVDVPPAALRAYLEGQIAYREARWETALEYFGRALAIDSSFALAAMGHSMTRGWVLTAPSSPGIRLARARSDLCCRGSSASAPRPSGGLVLPGR
jgi:serine/threonine-protein kinase